MRTVTCKVRYGVCGKYFQRSISDLAEEMVYRAGLFIVAHSTAVIKVERHARQHCDCTVNMPYDFDYGNLLWLFDQIVTTAFSLLASQYAGVFQIKQNRLEKFFWYALFSGNFSYSNGNTLLQVGEVNERMKSILALF